MSSRRPLAANGRRTPEKFSDSFGDSAFRFVPFRSVSFRYCARLAKRRRATCADVAGVFWSERRDLNSGPPVPQTGALTGLRYAPTDAESISLTRISRNTFKIVGFRDCPLRQCP